MGGQSKGSKKGTSIASPPSPSYGQAPKLGVSDAEMNTYNTSLADYNKAVQQVKSSSGMGYDRTDMLKKLEAKKPTAPTGIGSKELLAQTTMGVSNPYGTSSVKQNPDGSYTTVNEVNPQIQEMLNKAMGSGQGYSDALLSQSMQKLAPQMAARGLPMGSEINDTSRLNASMQAILGGQQMQAQDIQTAMGLADRVGGAQGPDVMGSYNLPFQAQSLPYMNDVTRQNMIYGNQAANMRQGAQNSASNKSSKMNAFGNVGAAALM
jgi:hypothetical protein